MIHMAHKHKNAAEIAAEIRAEIARLQRILDVLEGRTT